MCGSLRSLIGTFFAVLPHDCDTVADSINLSIDYATFLLHSSFSICLARSGLLQKYDSCNGNKLVL